MRSQPPHMLPPSMAGPKLFRVGFRCRPVQPALAQGTHPISYDWEQDHENKWN
jgi:hypothetical protein